MKLILKYTNLGSEKLEVYFSDNILKLVDITKFSSLEDIFDAYPMESFFHREDGPAVINLTHNYHLYYINGQHLTEEEFNKHLHNIEFNDKLNLIIE